MELELLELFANLFAILIEVLVALPLQDALEDTLHEPRLDIGTLLLDVCVNVLIAHLELAVLDLLLDELTADDLLDDVLAHFLGSTLGLVFVGLASSCCRLRGRLLDCRLHGAICARIVLAALDELGPGRVILELVIRPHVFNGTRDCFLGDRSTVVGRRNGLTACSQARASKKRHTSGDECQTNTL